MLFRCTRDYFIAPIAGILIAKMIAVIGSPGTDRSERAAGRDHARPGGFGFPLSRRHFWYSSSVASAILVTAKSQSCG